MPLVLAAFEISPKATLSSADRIALGKAISHWLKHHARHGAGASKDFDGGIDDLLAGHPIPSRFNRRVAQVKESRRLRHLHEKVDKAVVRQELINAGDDPMRRTFRFELFYLHDDRQRLVEIARMHVPAELVDDVMVNGLSWGQ